MNILRKRLLLLVSVLLAFLAASCSNGGISSGPPPPPPVGNFSNASLTGQYAFSMSGNESCPNGVLNFARAGSFTADGNGHITTGLEDVNSCARVGTLQFTGGSYSIGADGRGTLDLTNNTGTTHYSVALSTAAQGFVVQTDMIASASGSFQRQNSAAFSNPAIAGGYVFDFAGVDFSGASPIPASFVGRFDASLDASGGGVISNGLYDADQAGVASGQQAFPNGAFYDFDTNGDGTAFGRGAANIAGLNFAFYIVDATRIKFVSTDSATSYVGDAFAQQNMAFDDLSLKGDFAFLIGGSSALGPIATAGRFHADGGGNITNVFLDENNDGGVAQLPNGTVTGSYTVDANQLGGGTLKWTDTNVGTFSFIFYLISPSKAVFQEIDSGVTSDGTISAQTTSPITAASLAGNYAFNWSGVTFNLTTSAEVDFAGQFKLNSATPGTFTGALDYSQLDGLGNSSQFFNAVTNGSLALNGDGATFNTFTAKLLTIPSATLTFTAYVVDQNTIYVVGDTASTSKGNPIIAGTLARQP